MTTKLFNGCADVHRRFRHLSCSRQGLRPRFTSTAKIWKADVGIAAVEFALATPILLAILVPLVDLGLAFSQQIQLNQAVQAGAEYAARNPWNSNSSTAIASAITSATTLSGLTAVPAPSQSCGCASGTTITSATCGTTCSSGQTAGYYVTVNAQAPYSTVLPYSVLGSTLTAQAVVRVQ